MISKLTCNFLIAEPSLLKYKSFAMALILGERVFRRVTLCFLPNELEDIEANDVNLSEELATFLSITRLLGATNVPTEDIAVKVDAIFFLKHQERH